MFQTKPNYSAQFWQSRTLLSQQDHGRWSVHSVWTFCLLVPPAISSHRKEYVTAVDKPVSLLCEAEGFPPPDITWHKDGHALTESLRQRILSSGALQIAFAQPDDAGQYTCIAANVAGSSSVSTTLTVHGRLFKAIYFHLLCLCDNEKRSPRTNAMTVKTSVSGEQCLCAWPSSLCSISCVCLCVHTSVWEMASVFLGKSPPSYCDCFMWWPCAFCDSSVLLLEASSFAQK